MDPDCYYIMQAIHLLPSLKKRLILLCLIIAFGIAIAVFAPFSSSLFILYFGLTLVALGYQFIRLFKRAPVLTLSEDGILSRMTIRAEKIGLIYWSDIIEIHDTRAFWIIKGIELHSSEKIAEQYNYRIDKKYRSGRKTLLIYLSSEEISMNHKDLSALVNKYWDHFRTVKQVNNE